MANKDTFVIRSLVNPLMEYTILSDSKSGYGTKVRAEAIFQKCDEPNANGMAFPKHILSKAVQEAQNEIAARHFLGELDHPEDINDVNRISTVYLKCASHVITDLKIDGNYVVGRFETLDTPNGAILASLLKDKIKVGVSIRAVTDQDVSYGFDKVDTIQAFTLIAYDSVHNPAYNDAFVKTVMSSVIKISAKDNIVKPQEQKLISMTESDFKEIIQSSIMHTIKKLYKK